MEVTGYINSPQKKSYFEYWKPGVNGATGTVSSVLSLRFLASLAAFKLPYQSTCDPHY